MTVERIQSLSDSVGAGMQVLIVGLNPSPYSADSGIPYGRPGNRFWPAALASGLVSTDRDVDHALSSHHLGFTDLVRRTTKRADEVSQGEFEAGFGRVSRLIEWLKPGIVCFVGLSAWRSVMNRKAVPGLQAELIGRSQVYVMPHTSGLNAHCRLEDLTGHLVKVKKLARNKADR
jgi:TDG/mug DNA glycosylase family protein|tara:strand:+ start:12744 stop:13268 length:525 start_codon:yes stop_codon:yes gene_type:complete